MQPFTWAAFPESMVSLNWTYNPLYNGSNFYGPFPEAIVAKEAL